MKSDIIRKRSRHDAKRLGASVPETPSASPGASSRASLAPESSPTLAPDSTTVYYDNSSESDYRVSQSELDRALGHDQNQHHFNSQGSFIDLFGSGLFPGPYHPDILQQYQYNHVNDALPFASVDSAEIETVSAPSRSSKRRRMSVDSASEPPSSAVSYCSFNDGYSSTSSATSLSQRSSMEFPFSNYPSYNILRGSGNTFWHPSKVNSPHFVHPPMLPPEESPMDFLHPPMVLQDEDSFFSAYLHPPMVLEECSPAPMNTLQLHPPMLPNDSIYSGSQSGRADVYESIMHTY